MQRIERLHRSDSYRTAAADQMNVLQVMIRMCAALLTAPLGNVAGEVRAASATPEDLRVLPPQAQGRGEGLLRDEVRRLSHKALDLRLARYEKLKSAEDVEAYQREMRSSFIESLGGFPKRTPLNARVVASSERDGLRREMIIFESQPGFFVTGVLYLPLQSPPPHPVMLLPCGHSDTGKAAESYQLASMLVAKHGIAVFCYDPLGQGERKQVLADETRAKNGRIPGCYPSTEEHMMIGVAPILLGRNVATYMIWDGIRAIDYLETRSDLDTKRLGCAGISGGGMMTSYLMALDARIASAAPGCFITTSRRKNESPGPGDAEQNIYAQYVYGMDHADFLIMRAPRPTLILAATQDYVPIAGAWESFREAKRVFARLGYPERVDMVETDAKHGYSVQLREATVRWMRRWLAGEDEPIFEDLPKALRVEELDCAPQGQVLRLKGARTVFDLNRHEAARLKPLRKSTWAARSTQERQTVVRETAGIRPLDVQATFRPEVVGTVERSGYQIRKMVLRRSEGLPLPLLHFVPNRPNGRTCLYLDGRGKHADAGPAGIISKLVDEGVEVIAADLSGFGETAMKLWRYGPAEMIGDNSPEQFIAFMLGKTLVGLRAEDTMLIARYISDMHGPDKRAIEITAIEDAGIPALHAAALHPEAFSRVRLVRTIDSWERVIEADVTKRQLESVVHGALRVYDLPDLAGMAGNVELVDSVDPTGVALRR